MDILSARIRSFLSRLGNPGLGVKFAVMGFVGFFAASCCSPAWWRQKPSFADTSRLADRHRPRRPDGGKLSRRLGAGPSRAWTEYGLGMSARYAGIARRQRSDQRRRQAKFLFAVGTLDVRDVWNASRPLMIGDVIGIAVMTPLPARDPSLDRLCGTRHRSLCGRRHDVARRPTGSGRPLRLSSDGISSIYDDDRQRQEP
jgi:hypothetical protein